jgi:polysaccharide export outer membrane protein
MMERNLVACVFLIAGTTVAVAQQPQQPQAGPIPANAIPAQLPSSMPAQNYVLGPNDQILIRAPQVDEINERPFRIDTEGFITLPLVNRVRAAGLTVQTLEADLVARLREFIREPQVVISVTQFRSEPVFFLGAFRVPGIYPLQGRRTLIEMLSSVGGLQPNASRRIRVTRRAEYGPIPLSSAVKSPDGKSSTVEISMESLTQNVNPDEDIVLQSYDIVSVERGERVYVSGEVGKVAAIDLAERESISVAQAITEAGGFTQFATRDKVRVLRPILGTNLRAEIDIDLKRVFEGKDVDFPLLPNDILYVTRSTRRAVLQPLGTQFLVTLPYLLISLATSGAL